ncbi:MAG: hypothetical protein IT449_06105 [Phycisphaerales bacterium]|nr:hypothetical protein [Phycisphaerales bacterium]
MLHSGKLRVVSGVLCVIVGAGLGAYRSAAASGPPRGGGSVSGVPVTDAAALGGEESPQGCPGIPPCEELLRFKARCRLRVIGLLIVKVKLVPPDPGPGPQMNVLIGVNGQPFCVPFNGRRAKLVLENRVGQQFCEVLDPPNCFRPIIVDCGL